MAQPGRAGGEVIALALALACSDKGATAPGDSRAAGLDSADSGGAAGGSPESGGARLTVDYSHTCADPGARDSLGAFEEADMGADWRDGQHTAVDFLGSIYPGHGAAVGDFDGDGLLDIFLPQEGDDQLYRMSAGSELVDESAARLPGGDGIGVGATAVDVEGDGDLDLFVATVGGPDQLLLNDGHGVFSDGTAGSGLDGYVGESMGSAWGDFDGDGDLDPWVVQYGGWDYAWITDDTGFSSKIAASGYRTLLRNEGGNFTDLTDWLPADTLRHAFSFAAGWYDMDGDGAPEIYLANDYRPEYSAQDNLLFSVGEGELIDRSDETGAGIRINSMGMARGDLNADGVPDLFISGIGEVGLLESLPDGTWVDTGISRGIEIEAGEHTSWGTALVDVDNDTDLDAFAGFGFVLPDLSSYLLDIELELGGEQAQQPDRLWLQGADGQLTEVAESWGLADPAMTRGVIFSDFNRDGWLDLLRRYLDQPATIHLARCGAAHWLRVQLRDGGPNPFGVGATVQIDLGDQTQTRWIDAGSTGLGSGVPLAAHFGLGDAARVDALRVTWPDGSVSTFEDLDADSAITIDRR